MAGYKKPWKNPSFGQKGKEEDWNDEELKYDATGSTSFSFALVIVLLLLSFVTLIFLYSTIIAAKKRKIEPFPCTCQRCKEKQLKKKETHWKRNLFAILLLCGWIGATYMIYQTRYMTHDSKEFDPYAILGISSSASKSEIRASYRKLTMLNHPDRKGGDTTEFEKIAKAFKALTDEKAKQQFEEQGHLDGHMASTFGIALPNWVIDSENKSYVLILYAVVLLGLFPSLIIVWWYRQSFYSVDNIYQETTDHYRRGYHFGLNVTIKKAIKFLSISSEFHKTFNPLIEERPDDELNITKLMKLVSEENVKKVKTRFSLPYALKARTLILCHISRLPLPTSELYQDQKLILDICFHLLPEMMRCLLETQACRVLHTVENTIKLSAMIIQAFDQDKHSLLELPHIEEYMIGKRSPRSIGHLLCLTEENQREALKDLSDEEFENAINVARKIPYVKIDLVFSEQDEDYNTVYDNQTLNVTVRLERTLLGEMYERNVKKHDYERASEDASTTEVDVQKSPSLRNARKKKKLTKKGRQQQQKRKQDNNRKIRQRNQKNEQEVKLLQETESEKEDSELSTDEELDNLSEFERLQDKKQKEKKRKSRIWNVPQVHCPYFPKAKEEGWWVYACDRKTNLVLSPVIYVNNLLDEHEMDLPICPATTGQFTWCIMIRSDSYFCAVNKSRSYQLHVIKAPEIKPKEPEEEEDEEEEISESDE